MEWDHCSFILTKLSKSEALCGLVLSTSGVLYPMFPGKVSDIPLRFLWGSKMKVQIKGTQKCSIWDLGLVKWGHSGEWDNTPLYQIAWYSSTFRRHLVWSFHWHPHDCPRCIPCVSLQIVQNELQNDESHHIRKTYMHILKWSVNVFFTLSVLTVA